MIRVFGKAGKASSDKHLSSKIQDVCGIIVKEDDSLSTLICRKCEGLVSKASDFRQKSQNMQMLLEQSCSVKRCVELSPSCKPPSKRLTSDRRHASTEGFSKQLTFGESKGQATQQVPMEEASLSVLSLESALRESPSLPDVPEVQFNKDSDTEEIVRVMNSQPAVIVADIVKKRCPRLLAALKLVITDEIATACQMLCRRSDGSVLYSNRDSYESLRDFDFAQVWAEMASNIPYVIEIMNAVSGRNTGIEGTAHDLRVKFSFLYSVLMSERWHELSLLKRVNTILMIEGGCTKTVKFLL